MQVQSVPKRVDIMVHGVPREQADSVKTILETLNQSLKLDILDVKEVQMYEKKDKKSKLERFQDIFGKIAVDRIPTDEDKKEARYRDA